MQNPVSVPLARLGAALLVFAALAATPAPGSAQFGGLRDRLKKKVSERVERRTDEAMDRSLDKVECVVTDRDCIDAAERDGKQVELVDGPRAMRPGEGAWANYDFVPGERILFADDFSGDEVGDFPRRLDLIEGNAEIVDWNGRRYLSAPTFVTFAVPLPETLPQRFTVEFDFYAGETDDHSYDPALLFKADDDAGNPSTSAVLFNARRAGIAGPTRVLTTLDGALRERTYAVRVMADGPHAKVYLDERRVANAPNAAFVRGDKLYFHIPGWEGGPALLGNIRVAAGGKELYDALASDGRISVRGILFDSGSDRIKPESTAALKEIGDMLKAHPELAVVIEGHTDDIGSADANLALSGRRAEAVRAYLISTFDIEASRLEAKGFGATKPAASNDTAEGRMRNRRVELVKR